MENERELVSAALALAEQPEIAEREYGASFAREWARLFDRAMERGKSYLPENGDAVLTVRHGFSGVETDFHFDQLKLAEWFERDRAAKRPMVFAPKRLKRARDGSLSFHEYACEYDPAAPESALTEEMNNIFASTLPGLPPKLRVVFGNKWVDSRFTVFRQSSLALYLIQTDYVPAFLGGDLEVCLYLYMMDLCIIRENYTKVKDAELQKLLHVFRPSPMLVVKALIEPKKA